MCVSPVSGILSKVYPGCKVYKKNKLESNIFTINSHSHKSTESEGVNFYHRECLFSTYYKITNILPNKLFLVFLSWFSLHQLITAAISYILVSWRYTEKEKKKTLTHIGFDCDGGFCFSLQFIYFCLGFYFHSLKLLLHNELISMHMLLIEFATLCYLVLCL